MMSRKSGRSDSRYSELEDLGYDYFKDLRDEKVRIDRVQKHFRCPFCQDYERKEYELFDLERHATRIASVSKSASFIERARHFGLLKYLDWYKTELEEKVYEYYKDLKDGKVRIDRVEKYFRCPFCQDYERKEYELFELERHATRIASVSNSASFIERARHFGLLRYLDWYSKGKSVRRNSPEHSDGYLDIKGRKFETAAGDDALIAAGVTEHGEIVTKQCEKEEKKEKTAAEVQDLDFKLAKITDIQTEGERKGTLMCNLTNQLESKEKECEEIETNISKTKIYLENIMKQKDKMIEHYNKEMKMMENRAYEQLLEVYEAHKSSVVGLEAKREKLKLREKELKQSQSLNESEERELKNQNNLVEKNEMEITEQKKAYEKMLKLADKQKREKELLYKKIIKHERRLDQKQALELDIQRTRGSVEVMKYMTIGEEENLELKKKLESIKEELKKNEEVLDGLENLNQALVVKERKTIDEVQEARKELIKVFNNSHGHICVKGMGELVAWPFNLAAKEKYAGEDWIAKGVELRSLWQHYLRDPSWHPYKVDKLGGAHKEILDENDEKLKKLETEWGTEVCKVVITALNEMNEYNPRGIYSVKELWNCKEKRKASLKEGIECLLKQWKDKQAYMETTVERENYDAGMCEMLKFVFFSC